MKKVFDLCVKVGTYEKDGEAKNKYLNIGVILEGEKGMFMLLEKSFNPAGIISEKSTVLVSMFSKDKKEKAEKPIETINPEDIAWEE